MNNFRVFIHIRWLLQWRLLAVGAAVIAAALVVQFQREKRAKELLVSDIRSSVGLVIGDLQGVVVDRSAVEMNLKSTLRRLVVMRRPTNTTAHFC